MAFVSSIRSSEQLSVKYDKIEETRADACFQQRVKKERASQLQHKIPQVKITKIEKDY